MIVLVYGTLYGRGV